MRKKSGIISAFGGGHLDSALFGADASKVKPDDRKTKTDVPTAARQSRLGWRRKTSAPDRGEPRRS